MEIDWRRHDILVLDDVFDEDELSLMHKVVDSLDFEDQELGRGMVPARSRERAQAESPEIAYALWWHLAEFVKPMTKWFEGRHNGIRLQPELEHWVPFECNTRSRFYRYRPGADFREHEDEAWRPTPSVRSFLTVLVYLPTDERCVGGQTVVDGEVVLAKPGRVVVFPHDLLHEGRPVESGQKLVLRNDVIAVGVAGETAEKWREAGLTPPQEAAVAARSGLSEIDLQKHLIRRFDAVSLGDAQRLVFPIRGRSSRLAQNLQWTMFAYVASLGQNVTEEEAEEFDARTGFERKLQALVRAGRNAEVDAALDRIIENELAVREVTPKEARSLAEAEISTWKVEMALVSEHTTEHDFGWTFIAQSKAFVESGEFLDLAVGHGEIIVDRYTGAVWLTGSAPRDWLGAYRATGDPASDV